MEYAEFLGALQELLQAETVMERDTILAGLEEWDSLAQMAVMAWLDREFGIQVQFADITKCRNVDEVAALAGGAIK